MLNGDKRKFICRIDLKDNITFVNDEWLEFAKENLATELSVNILNKTLWDFIGNHTVQHLYKMLFNRAREGAHIKGLPFRCDSPDCRRFLEMELSKVNDSEVEIKTRIIKQEYRKPIPLLSDLRDCSKEIITICSFCKKIRIDESNWVEVEEAIKELRLGEVWPLPQLSHGACKICVKEWESRIDD
ncbi:hypothetical protein ACFL03_10770 [Thermodesulfobacteriota bacterium]